jgi:hypothetical protein
MRDNETPEDAPRILASTYVPDTDTPTLTLSDVRVFVGGELREARSMSDDDRKDLISKIRGGAHHELEITATTFRQKDGHPNRNFLRFSPSKLAKIASSFVGMPMLRDHNKRESSARLGTITKSELVERYGWSEFRQTMLVVKPDAVISVLDGTLDRFSIGWHATGPVLCSVHKQDVRKRGSCLCWPGDSIDVDNGKQTVEYEYQSADGIETSSVNVPAVLGTRTEDIRVALSSELGLAHRYETSEKGKQIMEWSKLASLLGLASITAADEDRVLAAVQARVNAGDIRATTAEGSLASVSRERDDARALAATETKRADAAQLDALIWRAYHDGRLVSGPDKDGKLTVADPLEGALRSMSPTAAESYVATLVQRRNIGGKPPGGAEPPRTEFVSANPELPGALDAAAKSLGLKTEDLIATHNASKGR